MAMPSGPSVADLQDEERRLIDRAFAIFDKDRSGSIEKIELTSELTKMGFGDKVTAAVNRILENVDASGNDQISADEFYRLMTAKLSSRNSEAEIRAVFNYFDPDKSGKISKENLREVSNKCGESLSDEVLADMIKEFELKETKAGYINMEEFMAIMMED